MNYQEYRARKMSRKFSANNEQDILRGWLKMQAKKLLAIRGWLKMQAKKLLAIRGE